MINAVFIETKCGNFFNINNVEEISLCDHYNHKGIKVYGPCIKINTNWYSISQKAYDTLNNGYTIKN